MGELGVPKVGLRSSPGTKECQSWGTIKNACLEYKSLATGPMLQELCGCLGSTVGVWPMPSFPNRGMDGFPRCCVTVSRPRPVALVANWVHPFEDFEAATGSGIGGADAKRTQRLVQRWRNL